MKVTLDTNVLISGTFWTGDSFRILDLIDRKKIICVLSEQIIEEYYKTAQSNEIIEKMEKIDHSKRIAAKSSSDGFSPEVNLLPIISSINLFSIQNNVR